MSVFDLQNELFFKRCLVMQRELFSRAKRLDAVRYGVVICIGLMSIFGLDNAGDASGKITLTCSILIGVSLLSVRCLVWARKKIACDAARLRQYSDIWLYSRALNIGRHLWGCPCSDEEAVDMIDSIPDDDERIESCSNWYSKVDNLSPLKEVVICQRQNLVWDNKLHLSFSVPYIVGWLVLLLIVSLMTIAFAGKNLPCALILVVVTYLDLIIDSALDLNADRMCAKKLLDKCRSVMTSLESENSELKTIPKVMELQNLMLEYRCQRFLIPDWYYKLRKDAYQASSDRVARDITQLKGTSYV